MAVEVGSIVEGKITGVKKFGAFVALPGKQEADDAISVAISPTPTENGIKTAYSYLFQL